MKCLVYLNWPETCFRAGADDLAFLKSLLPRRAEVVAVRSDRAFLRELPNATHVITWHFKGEWCAKAPKLKVVATPGAGRELVSQAAPTGVRVHFGHFHGAMMSESVAAFVLAWARGLFAVRDYAGCGGVQKTKVPNWPRVELSDRCFTVAGTRAAVVGYGSVGRAIGEKLAALGVSVTGYRHANIADLDAELPKLDWLVLALPGDTGTDNFLDRKRLAKLPRRAVVVNVGRGNAIDEAALLDALRRGRLAGAYLDVFRGEPGLSQEKGRRKKEEGKSEEGKSVETPVPDASAVPHAASILGTDPAGILGTGSAGILGTGPAELPGILGTGPMGLPQNLIRTPHSSAFSGDYMKRCFQELKDDGCL